jgi:hypothetical protein
MVINDPVDGDGSASRGRPVLDALVDHIARHGMPQRRPVPLGPD